MRSGGSEALPKSTFVSIGSGANMDDFHPFTSPAPIRWRPVILALATCLASLSGVAAEGFRDRATGKTAPEIDWISEGSAPTKLSSLRGKWVLLQCGGAWHRNSQATGQVFAHIRKSLEGKPFEFVEIFNDPTILDMQLFSFRTPVGIRAIVAKQRDLEFFRSARLPAWYLLDPTGLVRAEGRLDDPAALRKQIGSVLSSDPVFQKANLAPSPDEASLENLMFLYINRQYPEGEAAAEKILESDPGNEVALEYLHFCALWTKGYSGAGKLLADHLQAIQPSDRMRIFQALYSYLDAGTATSRNNIRMLAGQYPESRYLACILLMIDKLSDGMTREEENLLETAKNTACDEMVDVFRGYVMQDHGWLERAESLFLQNRSRDNLGMLPLVANLTRQGRLEEARGVFPPTREDLNPSNADPKEAWLKIHTACVREDWEEAGVYAKRYRAIRMEKAQGLLVGWLAAKNLRQQDLAAELQKQTLEFVKSSEKYRVAAGLLENKTLPVADDLTPMEDLNFRFDTALLFVLLEWEKSGSDGAIRMLKTLQPAFKPSDWPYAVLEQLRTFTLPRISEPEK